MEPRCTIITSPKCGDIFQRKEDNFADVSVEVLYTRPVNSIKVKAVRPNYSSKWISLTLSYSTASGIITLPAGDWYTIYMMAMDEDENVVEEDILNQIGVGEIFITCGQSNSLNFGDTLTKAQNSYVVSYNPLNQSWQPCTDPQPCERGPEVDMGNGGSIWPTVGDLLANQLHMPIGFYATGWGGAAVGEFGTNMVKYQRLLNALQTIGISGARAVLWHQGETDAIFSPNFENYKSLLLDLIERSRKDAGLIIPWMIAQAAFHPKAIKEEETLIRKAQVACCNGKDIIEGPNSDELQGDYRIKDSAHFTLAGLQAHGQMWAKYIIELLTYLRQ